MSPGLDDHIFVSGSTLDHNILQLPRQPNIGGTLVGDDVPLEVSDYLAAYLELEDRFLEFTRFVPLLKRHDEVISFELASLASSIGNWTETAFYRMSRGNRYEGYPVINKEIVSVDDFRDAFEPHYQLSKLSVRALPHEYGTMIPFEEFSISQSPEWFKVYSRYKHNLEALFNRMNLSLTIRALAGLFLLTVYPQEMRECAFRRGLVYSEYKEYMRIDSESAILRAVRSRQPGLDYSGLVGRVFAQTKLFRFEFSCLGKDGKIPHHDAL